MGSINLYKIDPEHHVALLDGMKEKMRLEKSIQINHKGKKFVIKLYTFSDPTEKPLSWDWIFTAFDVGHLKTQPKPKSVIVLSYEQNIYAVTFGLAYFYVDKYSDKDFGFRFARKMKFEKIKTTTLTTPNSKRNKTVNTYIDYSELEFDSGESFAKLKAKAHLPEDFRLFKPALEIGTSIRFVAEEDSLNAIIDIILYVEHVVATEEDKYKIPVFSQVKDQSLIQKLDQHLLNKVQQQSPCICISELDIIGVTETFNRNDSESILKYMHREKKVSQLTYGELRTFCEENNFDFDSSVLDIMVESFNEGSSVISTKVKNIIDYTDDTERCLLSKGIWYRYNDDYLNYLYDSIAEIKVVYHHEYDFPSEIHDKFIESLMETERKSHEYVGQSDDQIRELLKKKYYPERAFNELMARDHGFQNFDRQIQSVEYSKVELMDLYQDGCMFAVKFGDSSSKLCYAVDQSSSSVQMYKNSSLPHMPQIHSVAIWLVLKKLPPNNELSNAPDINRLNMLLLKNRLDQWKKEVRLQGFKPVIFINHR